MKPDPTLSSGSGEFAAGASPSRRHLPPAARAMRCLCVAALACVCADGVALLGAAWWQEIGRMAATAAPVRTDPDLALLRQAFFATARFSRPGDLAAGDKEYAETLRPYLNANDPDSDGDGLLDGEERALGTNPRRIDTDGDGLWDSTELRLGLNPLVKDSRGDGVSDGQRDSDGDGFNNADEQDRGYDPGSSNSSPAVIHPASDYPSLAAGAIQWDSFNIPDSGQSRTRRSHGHRRTAR